MPKPQPIDPRDELRRKTNILNLPEPVYQICPTTIKNTKEPAVFAQVKVCDNIMLSDIGIFYVIF